MKKAVPSIKQFQTELIQSIVDDSLQSFRTQIHQDIQNLHLEMLRQFQYQQVLFHLKYPRLIKCFLQTDIFLDGNCGSIRKIFKYNCKYFQY